MAPTNTRHVQIQYNTGQALRRPIGEAALPCSVCDAGPGVAVGHQGDGCRIPDVVVTCASTIDETARPEPLPAMASKTETGLVFGRRALIYDGRDPR